jgi:RNA polymerase-binding transcription factor DksA
MLTFHKNQRIAKALLREIDITVQQYGRQTLQEVVQDLVVRNVLQSGHPSDDQVLRTIYQTGVLRMNAAPQMAELHSLLERYTRGQVGLCADCGRRIAASLLERFPRRAHCERCQPPEGTR